jgi:indolepyruvate decarboxylase
VTLRDFMEALLAKFGPARRIRSGRGPAAAGIPTRGRQADQYDDKPGVITYDRFFQHSLKFLRDHDMLKDVVMATA